MHISLDSALGRQRRLNSVGESVLQIAPDAAAAYSLRSLTGGDPDVVRVRRESDNTEKDFSGSQIESGEMARWVNEQPTLPLDLRELDTNTGERDGALIEAAAAYSLRKLKEDFTGDVVEVRRNVDGETEGFTADEVTDGTLEDFVEGWELYPARGISETSQSHFSVTKTDDRNFRIVSDLVNDGLSDTKFITILAPQDGLVLGKQRVTFDVDVNSGDISNFMLRLSYRDDQTNLQPVAGSNSFEIDIVDDGESPNPLIYFAIHQVSSFDVSISNLKIYKSTVNELPLDQATGAAAAYSLRNLSSSFTGNVVEVRRSSDDAVQSFTASEVADGTLEDWVTAEQVGWNLQPTMQIASGGGSITSQSSTSTSSTFTVSNTGGDSFLRVLGKPNSILADAGDSVVVNISVSGLASDTLFRLYTSASNTSRALQAIGNGDNQELTLTPNGQVGYFGFTAFNTTTEATVTINSITVIGKSAAVRTWYDQSGSDNHAVQSAASSQPKIVEGGTLVTGGIDFNGAEYLSRSSFTQGDLEQPNTIFSVAKMDSNDDTNRKVYDGETGAGRNMLFLSPEGSGQFGIYSGSTLLTGDTATSDKHLFTASYNSTSSELFIDGTSEVSGDAGDYSMDAIVIGANHDEAGNFWLGQIQEIIIYNSDQSTKRRAIEENIANHYDISLAAFSRDGTVSTWYDQSGSTPANNATQTDPTKQPKIVEGGSLLEDNGIAGVDFDASNSTTLVATGVSGLVGSLSLFSQSIRDASGYTVSLSNSTTGGKFFALQEGGSTTVANPRNPTNGVTVSASVTGNTRLGFAVTTSDTYTDVGALGGALVNSTTDYGDTFGSGDIDQVLIGALRTVSETGHFDGRIREIIIYNSDQSDNRTAIEANIGETYGITDIPAANDTVNGFVQTWYDQSVNGNDAEQSTAAYQPKIVGEVTSGQPHAFLGALVFDGSDDFIKMDSEVALGTEFYVPMVVTAVSADSEANATFVGFDNSGGGERLYLATSANKLAYRNNSTNYATTLTPSGTAAELVSYSGTSSNFTTSLNGTDDVDAALVGSMGAEYIGGGTGFNLAASFREIIIYADDQSSNRPAIETNIANQYGITLS